MDVITIDFESFHDKDYSLSKMTTEAYVNDKRFEVIGVGVKVNSAETKTYSGSKMYIAGVLAGYNWKGSYVRRTTLYSMPRSSLTVLVLNPRCG